LFPGVSRSGATISAGIAGGLQRPSAARFSFLLSIPALLGAGIVAAADLRDVPDIGGLWPALVVGFVAAAVVGYISIRGLVAFLGRRPLYVFAAYCLAVGLAGLILTVVGA
jgi:undecaprenyl-diphosphatase